MFSEVSLFKKEILEKLLFDKSKSKFVKGRKTLANVFDNMR